MRRYQVCSNCVMDTSDSQISFDANGQCDHCTDFYENVQPHWRPDDTAALDALAQKIRDDGKGRDFDSILGMSGGLDSSYLLHVAVEKMGLRPLVFHVDGGWNSQIAVHNIECITEKLGLDLYTEVINWEEMRDFQHAFFKSGVPHLDIPQDMAFVAVLYKFAAKHKVKYILNGGNLSTECVRNPLEWLYYGTDMSQNKDIQKKFGTMPLKTYPMSSIWNHKIYLRYIRRIQVVKPLNMTPYIKKDAQKLLADTYGWQAYQQKHFESRFTRFFEGYWLPTRFGFDTRRVQFSSLILSKQMTRDEALKELENLPYDETEIQHDIDYVATKLGITSDELMSYHTMPKKSHRDYKSQHLLFDYGAKVLKMLGVERAIKR